MSDNRENILPEGHISADPTPEDISKKLQQSHTSQVEGVTNVHKETIKQSSGLRREQLKNQLLSDIQDKQEECSNDSIIATSDSLEKTTTQKETVLYRDETHSSEQSENQAGTTHPRVQHTLNEEDIYPLHTVGKTISNPIVSFGIGVADSTLIVGKTLANIVIDAVKLPFDIYHSYQDKSDKKTS